MATPTVPLEAIRTFLAEMDIELSDVQEIHCYIRHVEVTVFSRDSEGNRYIRQVPKECNLGHTHMESEVATDKLSFKIDQSSFTKHEPVKGASS